MLTSSACSTPPQTNTAQPEPIVGRSLSLKPVTSINPASTANTVDPSVSTTPLSRLLRQGDRFVGQYQCSQGVTEAVLEVERVERRALGDHVVDVTIAFHFNHEPTQKSGAERVVGTFDPDTRQIHVTPLEWIEQPEGYSMTGFTAEISSNGRVIDGKIDSPNCGFLRVSKAE